MKGGEKSRTSSEEGEEEADTLGAGVKALG